jgi:8-oxo-dGTP pyrophosphatase MutT (NUDIX family)
VYGVVHFRNRAVGVVPVGDDGRILLVGQHRYPLDEYSWEIPEGGASPHETPLDGARRELREETGFEAAVWRRLCRFSLSNSITDERGELFVATGLRPGRARPEPTEELATRWATLDEVLAEIEAGSIHDVMTIAGVSRYALQRGGGR